MMFVQRSEWNIWLVGWEKNPWNSEGLCDPSTQPTHQIFLSDLITPMLLAYLYPLLYFMGVSVFYSVHDRVAGMYGDWCMMVLSFLYGSLIHIVYVGILLILGGV